MRSRTPLIRSAMLAGGRIGRSAVVVLLLGFVLAAMTAARTCGGDSASRAHAFAALPNWTGLWETEGAARLSTTGMLVPPKLWGKPPYNAEWERKSRSAGSNAEPATRSSNWPSPTDLPRAVKVCEPAGFPAAMEHPVPDHLLEMLVTPEQTLLVSADGAIRHIYTDRRKHPKAEDLWPTGRRPLHWTLGKRHAGHRHDRPQGRPRWPAAARHRRPQRGGPLRRATAPARRGHPAEPHDDRRSAALLSSLASRYPLQARRGCGSDDRRELP